MEIDGRLRLYAILVSSADMPSEQRLILLSYLTFTLGVTAMGLVEQCSVKLRHVQSNTKTIYVN